MTITNETMKNYAFLEDMYADDYFPDVCVDMVKVILKQLCDAIEKRAPATLTALYLLTHAATEQINELAEEFDDHGSELETGARETIAADFAAIARAYGFDADVEELIATRDW